MALDLTLIKVHADMAVDPISLAVNRAKVNEIGIWKRPTVHYCDRCHRWLRRVGEDRSFSCLVLHGPLQCCHYGETVVESPHSTADDSIADVNVGKVAE